MGLEHPEEIARPWQDTLEPAEHCIPCMRAARLVEQAGGGNRRSTAAARCALDWSKVLHRGKSTGFSVSSAFTGLRSIPV
jgi:hypothetical protein